jgi:transposase-like protein
MIEIYQNKYLDNLVEENHRVIKPIIQAITGSGV